MALKSLLAEKPRYGSMQERCKEVVLSYHNLNYSVQVRERGYACFATYTTKKILKGVSGIMRPGMNAILGPSGSGKTTLLDILAGRKETGKLQGVVLVDGKPLPTDFKCTSGYVVQDDIVMGTLSVRENLNFSAALRLPQSTANHERSARVDQVLADMGLMHVADSKIGTQFIWGISDGERRRTNIGMELIISPSILFLDEPTTGLDAFTAASLMRLLAGIAKRGKIMIFSIHQPRYSVYNVFDSITLLSDGQTAYHGARETALTHFEQQGFVPQVHTNPADFFLDTVETFKEEEKFELKDKLSLVANYETSKYAKIVKADLDEIYDRYQTDTSGSESDTITEGTGYPTSGMYQMYVVGQRALTDIIRDPTLASMQYMSHLLQAVIVGLLYYQISDNPTHAIQDRVGVIFYIALCVLFSSVVEIGLFFRHRALFFHELVSGYYQVSAYFISKIMVDVLSLRLIPLMLFAVISYYMMGFQSDFDKFAFFTLILILESLTSGAYAFLFSALYRSKTMAILSLSCIFVVMTAFGGLVVNLKALPDSFGWVKYLSAFYYAAEALEINELKDQLYCTDAVKANNSNICPYPTSISSTLSASGTQYLNDQGFHAHHKWRDPAILGCFTVVLLVITYFKIRFMRKTR